LSSYSNTVHSHSNELHSHSKSAIVLDTTLSLSKLQFQQYVSYQGPNRLGNSTHSTGPTEAVRRYFCSVRDTNLSRQQRPQYWFYRSSLGNVRPQHWHSSKPDLSRQQRRSTGPTETVLGNSIKRPEVLLIGLSTASAAVLVQARTVPHSTNSTCPRQDSTPFIKPFKGPNTVSKAWVVIVIMAEVPLAVAMTTVVAEATKAAPIGAIATATAPVCLPRRHHWNSCLPSRLMARCRLHSHQ
jgi:hypothetical protein